MNVIRLYILQSDDVVCGCFASAAGYERRGRCEAGGAHPLEEGFSVGPQYLLSQHWLCFRPLVCVPMGQNSVVLKAGAREADVPRDSCLWCAL